MTTLFFQKRTIQAWTSHQLRIFVHVAELGSFTRAADQLGLAKGRVSPAVQQLEAQLGTRLLQRTTRSVRLTPDGEHFLERGKELLADAEQLQAHVPAGAQRPARPAAHRPAERAGARPWSFRGCRNSWPRIRGWRSGISTTDRRVDLVHEGFDCVLRVGPLRRLGPGRAAAGHDAQMRNVREPGLPARARHAAARWPTWRSTASSTTRPRSAAQGAGWEYRRWRARSALLPMRGAVTVNGTDAYQAACLAGLGLIQAPALGTQRAGRCRPAGRGDARLHGAQPMPVSLIYPHRRQLAPRVQAVMDWLAQVIGPCLGDAGPAAAPRTRTR